MNILFDAIKGTLDVGTLYHLYWLRNHQISLDYAIRLWGEGITLSEDVKKGTARYVLTMQDALFRLAGRAPNENDAVAKLQDMFSSTAYWDRIRELAYHMFDMSKQAGNPDIFPKDFWLAAEKHTLAIMAATVRTAGTPLAVGAALASAFNKFLPDEYLKRIEQDAYFMWKQEPYRHALHYWIKAEDKAIDRMTSGTGEG